MWSKVDLQFLGNSFIPLEKGVVRWHGLRSLVLWPLYLRADKLSQSPFEKKWANYGTVVLMQWDNMFRQLNRKTGTLHRLNQWIPAALIFIIFFQNWWNFIQIYTEITEVLRSSWLKRPCLQEWNGFIYISNGSIQDSIQKTKSKNNNNWKSAAQVVSTNHLIFSQWKRQGLS